MGLVPISLGHAAAVVLTVLIFCFVGRLLSMPFLKLTVQGALFALGLDRLFRGCHICGGGMPAGSKD